MESLQRRMASIKEKLARNSGSYGGIAAGIAVAIVAMAAAYFLKWSYIMDETGQNVSWKAFSVASLVSVLLFGAAGWAIGNYGFDSSLD